MNLEHAQLSMNVFDAIIIGVLCLSAVVAFFRGFLREVLSLVAWVGAGLITLYLFPQSTVFLKDHAHVKNEHVAAGAAALGTYFAALITISLFNSIIIRYLKTGSEVGIIDNALGLLFGAARGAFIVSLAFLLISTVYPSNSNQPGSGKKYPEWLQTSITKPYLEKGAAILMKAAPHYLSDFEDIVKKERDNQDPKSREMTDVDAAAKADTIRDDANGTAANTRKAVDNLLNSTNPTQEGTR